MCNNLLFVCVCVWLEQETLPDVNCANMNSIWRTFIPLAILLLTKKSNNQQGSKLLHADFTTLRMSRKTTKDSIRRKHLLQQHKCTFPQMRISFLIYFRRKFYFSERGIDFVNNRLCSPCSRVANHLMIGHPLKKAKQTQAASHLAALRYSWVAQAILLNCWGKCEQDRINLVAPLVDRTTVAWRS